MQAAGVHALATLVVVLHIAFVLFVVAGGFLAWRWHPVMYVHIPAALWGIYVEWSGAICPLTPVENALRSAAGLELYAGDFVARYIFPLLYPDGLTRSAQVAIGAFVFVVNGAAYARIARTRKKPASRL